uniref:Leucine-rich repeats and IQ motif containing 1 n=1 Tax=Lepisosteus oculatus TaxID=7918 RepID=W5NHR6_LEPOC
MNNRLIEEAIEQELSKICINPSDTEELETFSEDETIFDEEPVPDEIPESVLSCLELVKNRMHNAEQLILQDLEETDCDLIKKDTCGTISNHSEDFWMKLASDYHEDPIKLRERIIHEIEEDESLINQNRPEFKLTKTSVNENLEATLANMYLETEKQCLLELEILEKKFKEMEEKRAAELKAKKDQQLKEQREEEEKRRHRQKEFQEELKNIESENMENQNEVDETERKEFEKLQEDLRAQEELIKRLEKTMEEERTAFEEQQATERKRVEDLRRRAATRIQAAVRGFLIRRASAFLLSQRREERKKKKELQLQLEQERREREEKCRRKLEEQKCREEEEREKRRAAYEKAKEEERLRLEEERKLKLEAARQGKKEELRKREELERKIKLDEEDKRKKEVEEKRSEEHRNQEEMEKKRFREFKRRKEEVQNAEQIQEQNVEQILAEKLKGSQFGEFDEFENKGDGTKLNDKLNETLQNNSTDCEKVKDDSGFSDYDVDNKDASVQEISLQSNKKSLNCASEEMPCLEDNEDKTNMENAKKNEGLSQEESEKCHNMEKDLIMSFRPTGCIPEPKANQMCLPECTEQKRLAWMKACTPWSKISMQNKRKEVVKRKVIRRGSAVQLPALSTNTILQSGDWISLQQVTAVTLQDLPGCSLSTLSECTKLQMLTMKRCGLKALEGISGCKDLKYINVQENAIQYINCQGMDNLDVLLLNHNQLASIHGLDGAVNLHALELSHNHITRICGLESLKKLQRLVLSHNQLISTKGLKDTATLLHLDCSYNHLTEIEGIENCALLCTLKLQGNNLTEPPSLVNHVLMKELYIDDNSISSLESLSACWLPLLQVLSLSQNSLTHIPPLLDFLSLKELDVSCNCISELRDVHLSLEGSTNLRELNLTGNPVQQETNWRSSLQKMLPGLKKINGEPISSTQVYLTDRSARPPPGSFLALCQAQLKQLELLLKRHDRELQSILSPLDAPMIRSQQSDELITLAEEHRYAHEYGDLSVNDGDEPETQSNLLMQEGSDRHQHNFPFISKAKENNQVSKDPSTRWITARICCIQQTNLHRNIRLLLAQQAAALVIQSAWRKYSICRNNWNKDSSSHTCISKDICLDIMERAAIVIQATWKGYVLRKKLASALAAVKTNEVDDDFEEVNMEDFAFDEAALEKEWITLDSKCFPSKMLPLSDQLYWPKPPSHQAIKDKNMPVVLCNPKQAWLSEERDAACQINRRLSSASRAESALTSEKEKLLEEWYFILNNYTVV